MERIRRYWCWASVYNTVSIANVLIVQVLDTMGLGEEMILMLARHGGTTSHVVAQA